MLRRLLRTLIPTQIMMSMRKIDVLLVENRRPLERCTMQDLTGCAVAELGGEGLLA